MKGNSSPKINRFYIKMEASLMHAMHIPKKFAETIKGSVNETIKLEVPSGIISWNVKMIRSNDTYTLQSGWKDFVTANNIDKNDTLVFTYIGSCSFKVLIFDACGCEKLAPFFAKKSEESDDSSVRVGAAFHSEVKKELISLSSSSDSESASQVSSHFTRARKTGGMSSYKRKQREFFEESTESDEGSIPVRTKEKRSPQKKNRSYVVPQKTNLNIFQKDIADRMAKKTQNGSDLFVKILTPINIHPNRYCTLNLPHGFACNTLQNKKQMITLLPANLDKSKGCIAKYRYKKQNVKCISWREFALKNRLKVGDLCLFELRKQEIRGKLVLTMVVHFETESENSDDSSVEVGGALHCEIKNELVSLSSGTDTETSRGISSRTARALKRKRRDFLQESTESDEGNMPVRKKQKRSPQKRNRLYIVPHNTNLKKSQKDIADRLAQKAQKGSDLFVKILTQTSIHTDRYCSLILPCGFALNTLRNKKQMITLLPTNLDKRKGCIAKYNYKNQNAIRISWREFARKNGLKVGDVCLCELRKQEVRGKLVLTMVVHFETNSKNSDDSSVQVGAALHREIKKEFISLSSGSNTETSSDISSRTAQALKRKRRASRKYFSWTYDTPTKRTVSNEGRQRQIRKRKDTPTKRTSMLYIVPESLNLTEAQEELANRMTQKTQKGSKLFVKILTKCNTRVHGGLNLPKGFACNVLQSQKTEITLVPADLEKRSKRITGNYSKNKSARYIGKGWPDFVRRNGLKKGDFCLFELREEKKQGKSVLTMVVHFDH